MLQCVDCKKEYPEKEWIQRCDCGGAVELERFTGERKEGKSTWSKFSDFFPYDIREETLGEGDTPLTKGKKISENTDLEVYLKNETMNPTWSFKDRGTLMGIKRALELGSDSIGTVSTGNMAASVSAYGAFYDMPTKVLVPSHLSKKKVRQISVYDPDIIQVQGDYGRLYFESLEVGKRENTYFINSDDPYRIEGYKSIALELASQIKSDHVVIPTSSGGLFRGMMKGFKELSKSGLIKEVPTPIAVQAEGCCPITRAFKEGEEEVEPWKEPDTTAGAIANPYPPSGDRVLDLLREKDGHSTAVSDEEMMKAQRAIAKEGIYCQPASSVGVAAMDSLLEEGMIERGSKVTVVITGSGLKTAKIWRKNPSGEETTLEGLSGLLLA